MSVKLFIFCTSIEYNYIIEIFRMKTFIYCQNSAIVEKIPCTHLIYWLLKSNSTVTT